MDSDRRQSLTSTSGFHIALQTYVHLDPQEVYVHINTHKHTPQAADCDYEITVQIIIVFIILNHS